MVDKQRNEEWRSIITVESKMYKSERSEEMENLFNNIDALYHRIHQDQQLPLYMILLTDDLNRAHAEVRPDSADSILSSNAQSDFNGRMVPPRDRKGKFSILINTEKVNEYTEKNTFEYIGTFAHEMTHAVDYYQMAALEQLNSYDQLERTGLYTTFQLWSEFHARREGYKFLNTFREMADGVVERDKHIEWIKTKEGPFQWNYYRKMYVAGDAQLKLYITMQFLGRYSVWNEWYPESFNGWTIKKDSGSSMWLVRIFEFLMEHKTLESIYPCWDEFREILQENWEL